jgi:hypothetical protein
MIRSCRSLTLVGLTLAVMGCRFNANRPPVPAGSSRPSPGASGRPAVSDVVGKPAQTDPKPQASPSAVGAIPVVARTERDLRHPPQDLALGPAGEAWLLAADGIWQRPAGAATWTADGDLKTLDLPAVPATPPAEIVVDPSGQPWILDPTSGRLWKRTAAAKWQVAASGLTGACGLSVAGDGTAYAVASDAAATVWKIAAGTPVPLHADTWKHPVTTAVDAKGALLVVDDALRVVHRYGTDQRLAPIPPALGRLTIGRESDGAPLIVGGQNGVTAIRIGDKSLSFPSLPATSLPTAGAGGFGGLRLFGLASGQYLAMARMNTGGGVVGELRTVTVVGRKSGETYALSTSYTGTALALRSLALREVETLGKGYQLYRIRGASKAQDTTNWTAAWYFDYWNASDRTLATISLAPLGLITERSFIPEGLAAPTLLGDVPLDSHQAWAAAVKVGMPNHITGDMELRQDGTQTYWRIHWLSGGQTYRVDAVTGAAAMETS